MNDEQPPLPAETVAELLAEGEKVWEEFRAQAGDRHHWFIPCDQLGAYETLCDLRGRASTFLELGSGAGVVTILASLLGFESYGIEIEPWLVDRSIELAEQFGASATFAEGTFVPPEFEEEVQHLTADYLTPTAGAPAFEELGLDLGDFDLIFGYPWPGGEEWLEDLVQRYAQPTALFLTYDAREGFQLERS